MHLVSITGSHLYVAEWWKTSGRLATILNEIRISIMAGEVTEKYANENKKETDNKKLYMVCMEWSILWPIVWSICTCGYMRMYAPIEAVGPAFEMSRQCRRTDRNRRQCISLCGRPVGKFTSLLTQWFQVNSVSINFFDDCLSYFICYTKLLQNIFERTSLLRWHWFTINCLTVLRLFFK